MRIPNRFILAHWRQLLSILALMMAAMWLASSLLAWALVSGSFLVALLFGAIITPTDPVLANSIVSGPFADKHLPARLRHRISFEAGANDGLGLLFVALPMAFIHPPETGFRDWLITTLFWSVLCGSLFGAIIGLAAGALLHWAETRRFIDRASYLAYSVALTLITLGAARILHTDGILAVFTAGLAFTAVLAGSEEADNEFIQETFNQFFLLPVFVFFGLIAPWNAWFELGWTGWIFALAVLFLRRLPAAFLARPLCRPLHDVPSLAFFGWFGPLGIAALFYGIHAEKETGDEMYWVVTSLAVFVSIFAHGATAPGFTRLYSRHRTEHGRSLE